VPTKWDSGTSAATWGLRSRAAARKLPASNGGGGLLRSSPDPQLARRRCRLALVAVLEPAAKVCMPLLDGASSLVCASAKAWLMREGRWSATGTGATTSQAGCGPAPPSTPRERRSGLRDVGKRRRSRAEQQPAQHVGCGGSAQVCCDDATCASARSRPKDASSTHHRTGCAARTAAIAAASATSASRQHRGGCELGTASPSPATLPVARGCHIFSCAAKPVKARRVVRRMRRRAQTSDPTGNPTRNTAAVNHARAAAGRCDAS